MIKAIEGFESTDAMSEPTRTSWVFNTASDLRSCLINRFQNGQADHTGDIGSVPTQVLMDEMFREMLDMIWYYTEFRRRFMDGKHVAVPVDTLKRLVGIACASDGLSQTEKDELELLRTLLKI